MTADFRALCAELVESVEVLLALRPAEARPLRTTEDRLSRARAALADGPAVPKPKPTPKEPPASPTKRELFELLLQSGGATQCVSIEWIEPFANAVLARWGRQPAPPADGEVAELVAWLRSTGEGQPCLSDEGYARLTRAAELLERQATACAICERERLHQSTRAADMEVERQAAPVPVPVNERLPGPEDCDSHGWCWVLYSAHSTWTLEPPYGQDGMPTGWTHWLSAHALPLPEVGE